MALSKNPVYDTVLMGEGMAGYCSTENIALEKPADDETGHMEQLVVGGRLHYQRIALSKRTAL